MIESMRYAATLAMREAGEDRAREKQPKSGTGERRMNIKSKKNELYQELELFDGNIKIGEAEVDIKGKMISRLTVYEPYQENT